MAPRAAAAGVRAARVTSSNWGGLERHGADAFGLFALVGSCRQAERLQYFTLDAGQCDAAGSRHGSDYLIHVLRPA